MSASTPSFQALIDDHQSGSSEILKKAVEWVQSSLQEGQKARQVLSSLEILCRAHPSMALLQSFYNFFKKIPLSRPRVQAWLDMYQKHEKAACKHFAEHLSHFKNVLAYSNSGLLAAALASVKTSLNIFCTEGRPAGEGAKLAESLSQTKHKLFFTTDIAAFSVIPRVEALAFGCDSITPRGIVNKIGTAALAHAGHLQGKMTYFIGTSEKIIEWNDDLLLRQGPRDEVFQGPDSIHVENYYFDLTPVPLVRGVFVETGMMQVKA
jgi:translation initiation factor eIF-2B subunit delta